MDSTTISEVTGSKLVSLNAKEQCDSHNKDGHQEKKKG